MKDKNGHEIEVGDIVVCFESLAGDIFEYEVVESGNNEIKIKYINGPNIFKPMVGEIFTAGSKSSFEIKHSKTKLQCSEIKCECGGEKANTTHSTWCPKY